MAQLGAFAVGFGVFYFLLVHGQDAWLYGARLTVDGDWDSISYFVAAKQTVSDNIISGL